MVGFKGKLQETMVFTTKITGFPAEFPFSWWGTRKETNRPNQPLSREPRQNPGLIQEIWWLTIVNFTPQAILKKHVQLCALWRELFGCRELLLRVLRPRPVRHRSWCMSLRMAGVYSGIHSGTKRLAFTGELWFQGFPSALNPLLICHVLLELFTSMLLRLSPHCCLHVQPALPRLGHTTILCCIFHKSSMSP